MQKRDLGGMYKRLIVLLVLLLFVRCIVLIISLVLLKLQERIYKYGRMNSVGLITLHLFSIT